MIDLPPEIWIHIASYLPHETLRDLYSVNSVFFDAAMDLRWGEVVLERRYLLHGTQVDPFVAAKVKKLSIIFTLMGESAMRHTRDDAFRFRDGLNFLRKLAHRPKGDRIPNFMQQLTSLNPKLINLRHLNIDTSELPPKYDLCMLCTSFWANLGANLRSRPVLPALSELKLEFTGNIFQFREDGFDADFQAQDVQVMEMLARFVNTLSPSLEGLRIWSWAADLDTSHFFLGLAVFPKLQYLGVRMSFDRALRDPEGLKNVLWNHAPTLQKIELRLNPSRFHLNADSEDPMCRWLQQCLTDERCFSQVSFLDFYPTTTAEGTSIVLDAVKRISNTAIRIILRDRYLQHDEALSVIDAASECMWLRFLRMNVFRFDIDMLDRLAEKLPNLEGLWISIGDHVQPNDITTFGAEFTEQLKTRSYDRWKLKDLAVWQSGSEVDLDAMHSLATTIPSLETF
ncbi:hypothetical protein BDN70DRAFT_789897, partial [Pholiota conissans]